MNRLAGDAAGLVLAYLTLDERLDSTAQVSRLWRAYTHTSLVRWARHLTLHASLTCGQETHAGPMHFVQSSTATDRGERGVYHFVTKKHKSLCCSAALQFSEVRIQVPGQAMSHVSCVNWTRRDGHVYRGVRNRFKIHVQEHSTVFSSLLLTAKDVAWMAPIATRNRLSLMCMLIDTDSAIELRTTLHAIARYAQPRPHRTQSNLAPLINALYMRSTQSIGTAEFLRQVRALLALTTHCHKFCVSNGRSWWLEHAALTSLFASTTEGALAQVVAEYTKLATSQDTHVRLLRRV
jgi:hypothetical protein